MTSLMFIISTAICGNAYYDGSPPGFPGTN